ncbi:hypothetical protein GX411_05375 [Candidatus Fermentibacteria bacterium]|nr:hypothetical protein [Candidatus Fermentibacteria bacterium]
MLTVSSVLVALALTASAIHVGEGGDCRTIAEAVEAAMPGDTVLIHEGIYHEQIVTVRSGESGARIVLSAVPGDTVVIDGSGADASNGIVVRHSFITVEGLDICGWSSNAAWVEHCRGFEMTHCTMHGVVFGLGLADGAKDFRITECTAYDYDLYGFDASPSGGAPCSYGVFKGCTARSGRDRSQNVDGFALGHGEQHHFAFLGCTATDVFDGFDISASNTLLKGCTAEDCWNSGFKVWQDSVFISGCTSKGCGNGGIELDWDGEPGHAFVEGCTIEDAGTYSIWVEAGDTLSLFDCVVSGGDNIGLCFERANQVNYFGDRNVFHNDEPERLISLGYEVEYSVESFADWIAGTGQDGRSTAVAEMR